MSFALVYLSPPEQLELLSSYLFDEGALGVELQEPDLLQMPGTPPLPAGRGRAIAHFDSREAASSAAEALLGTLEGVDPGTAIEIQEEDWSRAWRAFHKPTRLGPRTWVQPPWEPAPAGPGEICVTIDPGMAFGTGSHPTTSLCLARVDELLAARPGADLLDVGTGSGIIAILAAKLGAGRVCGTENDPVALQVAAEGAALNGLEPGRISWALCDCDALPAPYDRPYALVVANILLNTLVELAPQLARKVAPGGLLVLSGLLSPQADEARAAYVAQGLLPSGQHEKEGWVRVELSRPA
jgi:ribosomal protein L11 methyltransferase